MLDTRGCELNKREEALLKLHVAFSLVKAAAVDLEKPLPDEEAEDLQNRHRAQGMAMAAERLLEVFHNPKLRSDVSLTPIAGKG